MAQGTRNQNPHIMFVSEQPFSGTPDDGSITFTINWADRPHNRLAAMQFGNPRELKLIGEIVVGGSNVHVVIQELYKPLQRYAISTMGHYWYRMPKELLLGYVADATMIMSQNPDRPHFTLRAEKTQPVASADRSPKPTSYLVKVKEPWIEVTRSRSSKGAQKNRFAELGPQGKGKLKVSNDGVLSINSVPIPKSPPPQQFHAAIAQDPGLKTIATFETPPVQVANAPAPAAQPTNVQPTNIPVSSIYDLF